jgi:tRNA(Ile)-lysidine synthetase-like protein
MNCQEYKDVLNFWFGKESDKENKDNPYREFWFDRSKDDEIKEKYSILLTQLERNITKDNYKNHESEYILSIIIVLDQFSRSIYRNDCNNKKKVKENDEIAFLLASLLLEREYDKEISLAKRIFILMPYRHQKNSDLLDIVLEKIYEYSNELGESPLLCRFRNATLASYTPLTDRISLVQNDKDDKEENFIDVIDEKYFMNHENDKDDEDNTKNSQIYKTMKFFVREGNIKNIGISLSGGVDSMVISYILSLMKDSLNVYAMHIEYCNREESRRETDFISSYCKKLNIPLYVRKIHYMSRDSVHRNFYEEETRNIRFSTYRYLSEKHNISGWCLGHHKGDISENILMNLYSGRNLLDLTVMKKESIIDKVTLYRPLLDHP